MFRIISVLLLALCPALLHATALPQRLAEATNQAEAVSNVLLSREPESLTTEDWLVLSEAQRRLRNKDAAMQAVNRAIELAGSPYLQANGYLLKAQIYGILYRDTAIAITQLELAEQQLQQAEDQPSLTLYSNILQSFAQAYNQLGDLTTAMQYAEQSLKLAIRLKQSPAELNARIMLGRLALQNNAFAIAYQQLQLALNLATTLKDEPALASIHFRLGMAYRKIEDYPQALEHLLHARERYQAQNNASSYVYTLIYIAETYLENGGQATEAEQYFNEALALSRQQDDLLRVGVVTLGLGRLAVINNQPQQALQYFNDALQLFRQQNVQTYLQEASLALTELLLQQGDLALAQQLLQPQHLQSTQMASYLRYRYHDLSARLHAALTQWQQAYEHQVQASKLKFEEVTEQSKLQLDILNKELTSASANHQQRNLLQQLEQQQRSVEQVQQRWLVGTAVLLTLLLVVTALYWRQRNKKVATGSDNMHWQAFCQHFAGGSNHLLLAITPIHSQTLKYRFGEQRVRQVLQHYLLNPSDAVLASCLHDDILWLAVSAEHTAGLTQLQTSLLKPLRQLIPNSDSPRALMSLALDVTSLLGAGRNAASMSALRETVWLTLYFLQQQHQSQDIVMRLEAAKACPCEWGSDMVRQDVLSALRLGDLTLYADDKAVARSAFDALN